MYGSGEWRHCRGVQAPPPPRRVEEQPYNQQESQPAGSASAHGRSERESRWGWQPPVSRPQPTPVPESEPASQPRQQWPAQQWPWDGTDDRLAEMTKQASDTVSTLHNRSSLDRAH